MFEKWHDYYLMLGPSAGALIGLLFVVATLMSNIETDNAIRGMKTYTSPNVLHMGAVLFLSGLALAPEYDLVDGGAAVLIGVIGMAVAFNVARGVRGYGSLSFEIDFWCYGVAIGVIYAALTVSGVLVALQTPGAAFAYSLSLLALLCMAIRNSWDLVSWIAPRSSTDLTHPDPPAHPPRKTAPAKKPAPKAP
jgi:hypothetical protein